MKVPMAAVEPRQKLAEKPQNLGQQMLVTTCTKQGGEGVLAAEYGLVPPVPVLHARIETEIHSN